MQNLFLQRITNSLFIAVFLLTSLGQIGRITPASGIHFYLFEPLLMVLLVLLGFQLKAKPFQKLRFFELSRSIKWFIAWMIITFVLSVFSFSVEQNRIALLYLVRLSFYLLLFPYVLTWVGLHRISLLQMRIALFVFFGIFVLSGFIQYFFYPDLRNLFYAGWDPHYYRVFGLYLEPVIYATVAGLFLLYFSIKKLTPITIAWSVVSLFAVIASFSRAVYIAIAGVSTLYLKDKINWKLLVGGVLLIAVIYIALPKPSGEGVNLLRTSTIASRSADYKQGLALTAANPLAGIGYNHIGAVKKSEIGEKSLVNNAASSFHSSLIIVSSTMGIIGLLLYINMLLLLIRINTFFAISTVFLILVSLFDNVLLHPLVLLPWLFLGSVTLFTSRA